MQSIDLINRLDLLVLVFGEQLLNVKDLEYGAVGPNRKVASTVGEATRSDGFVIGDGGKLDDFPGLLGLFPPQVVLGKCEVLLILTMLLHLVIVDDAICLLKILNVMPLLLRLHL